MTGKNATELLRPEHGGIARAAAILANGGLVAVPTETVYGLAARADSVEAVAQIYATKGRPDFNPLIVHVRDIEQARTLAHFDERALEVASKFWPGPFTLVLPLREGAPVAPAVTAGLSTIALRAPAHPVMRKLLEEVATPLAAPSANRSEAISPTSPDHVIASLADASPAVLDGGTCDTGLESTIVALRDGGGWSLLRPGPITKEVLDSVLGAGNCLEAEGIEAPGQLARHYSPGKPMRLEAREVASDEFLIGFGEIGGDCNLSARGDLNEAAAQLYASLHLAAASSKPRIAVAPIAGAGIAKAINDRLRRAASDQSSRGS